MALTYFHDIDDELIEYLKGRIPLWKNVLETEDGQERIRLNLKDGTELPEEEYVPVYFRYGNIQERQKLREEIFADDSDVTFPVIVVQPLEPENLDSVITYTDYDQVYDGNNQEVTLHKGKRRLKFNYQIEAVTKRWSDYQVMKSLFDYRLFNRDVGEDYITLFNQNYLIDLTNPQRVIEEEANLFRYIKVVGIEMDLYTLPDEVVESVESVITNLAQGTS